MIGGAVGERTIWWCERCRASGIIEIDPRASVYDAVTELTIAHDQHLVAAAKSCAFNSGKVRVERVEQKAEGK